ncbi:hypothetical protein [Streptomyces sp. Wb2n-11]|uniref:hypothetical protein n=1 Tax=Streptomyces sp. Wb2n-11 TaxID=1030533 RepID=UPI000AFC4F4A|nr:hypothetical protein [Streptomyces sp. Wb2n-11]
MTRTQRAKVWIFFLTHRNLRRSFRTPAPAAKNYNPAHIGPWTSDDFETVQHLAPTTPTAA